MNSVCIINTLIPYFNEEGDEIPQGSAAEFGTLLKALLEQGASVLNLGPVAHKLRTEESVAQLVRIIRDVRQTYPEAIFQLAARNLAELDILLKQFHMLMPDIVSVPLDIFCDEAATGSLRDFASALRSSGSRMALDVHDLSMVFRAVRLQHDGLLDGPLRINLHFDQERGVPPDRHAFTFFVQTLRRLAPEATWSGFGGRKCELELARWSMEMGGHCRAIETHGQTGASAHAARETPILSKVIQLCKEYGRRPASPGEARHVLSLDSATHTSLV
ncbi:3-keto-5-aminohexanoate cleavage protein [Paraburkholderia sp. DHOC27]|uniref:3-keto-5-aminohexanoate cleavage protein n=1 Tax=Paraburkholderia sp. DHOC27 TaxID=2303330 RepID=UPI000E3D3434|nr:3-keto-5-aminohexanoate cleavage protein [Paraburkholderia sp. DHOC27]RFU49118.1 hypothetical protein D0B32_04710 [Paraburkholderia sp. DHOC27]